MSFYESFLSLCARAGITPSAAAEAIGLSRSSVNGWKNGKMPRESTLERIAQLFNTTLEVVKGVEEQGKIELNKDNVKVNADAENMVLRDKVNALEGEVQKLNVIIEEKQKMIDLLLQTLSHQREDFK